MSLSTSAKRVALVTGSGKQRVGWHVANALAGRGYAIAVHFRSSASEANQTVAQFQGRGVQAAAFGADLTDERQVRELVAKVVERFGRLDVLVNAAAAWKSKRLE